jgi:hypothetical protein
MDAVCKCIGIIKRFYFFYSEVEKIDDIGWKAKLKIPPKDRRVQTSVSPTL